MCGIVGALSLATPSVQTQNLEDMLALIAHRGPDDAGYLFYHTGTRHKSQVSFYQNFCDSEFAHLSPLLPCLQDSQSQKELARHEWDLFLAHRRLAIIDKSPAGHQPMSDLSRNIWLCFNGEIYNFKALRAELEGLGHQFFTQTDTEVLLYAYVQWGIDCVQRLNGMFAFALYDNFKKRLYLARDRYGIKPLYYGITPEKTLVFASENRSIVRYDSRFGMLDCEALLEYFTFQNIFTDKTFFKGIHLLPAGHYLAIDLATQRIDTTCYWDFCFQSATSLGEEECAAELERLFRQSVSRQLVSDVPLGGYLSGGIDSGSICALAAESLPYLNTFTIGFDLTSAKGIELGFDERAVSERLSYLFKTEHYEMVLKSGDMERCLRTFAYHLEEPRVGQSYPNFYAAKLASKFVRVVLSGCGGDELFGGYPWRYYQALDCHDFEDYVDKYYLFWQRLVPNSELKHLFAPIAKDVAHVWTRDIFRNVLRNTAPAKTQEDYINNSLYFEAKTFLHGLLVVEDKLSMAHSLETRVPFLDNELVDFAQSIPLRYKLRNLEHQRINENDLGSKRAVLKKTNDGKLIFRKMLHSFLPNEVTDAIKKGFSSPDSSWFEGESLAFVRAKLFDKNAPLFDYLDYNTAHRLVSEHLEGKANRRLFIWSLLNFNEWCAINLRR